MSYFPWRNKYSVGNQQMDNEHKLLVDLIDQLHDAFVSGRSADTALSVADTLVEYTKTHFVNEERLMEEAGYKSLESHRKNHQKLTQQAIEIKNVLKKIL